MSSDTTICNLALSLVGSDATITSIDPPDSSVEAGHCARFFTVAKLELLDSHPFTFAKKRVVLAEVTNNSDVWSYAYQVPSDCINPTRILTQYDVLSLATPPAINSVFCTADELALLNERAGAEFEIEGTTIYTHEPEATLVYVCNPVGRSSPTFEMALAHLLGAYLCGPIIKGTEGMKTASAMRQIVFGPNGTTGLAGKARAIDANNSLERHVFTPGPIRARA